jgi:hypothetical protein
VPTVFDLVGTKEDDMTACLAYVLAKSPVFMRAFIRDLSGDGKLQSIRHVDEIEQFDNPHTVFPEAIDQDWEPHYLFHLGPPIVPAHTVRNGPRIRMANRCWCMIDTLLTAKTISDALTETQKRQNAT